MSKSILITGLILGKETNMCSCRNINVGWLYNRPTDLLWADRVVVTRNEWKEIISGGDNSAISQATKLVFEILHSEGVVQVIPDTIIGQSQAESILQTVKSDLQYIEDLYTESENENDPVMRMGQYHFCVPALWTLYAAIAISRSINASFSLEQDELAYLSALIPRKYHQEIIAGRNMAMEEVLNLYLPKVELWHPYLSDSLQGRCDECTKKEDSSSGYLKEIEKQMNNILELRQYDEIRMTCEVLDKICERNAAQRHVLTGEELWEDLREEAARRVKTMKEKKPKIKKWNKIASYVSIGLSAVTFFNPAFALGAAAPAVASQILSEKENSLEKDASWVCFVNNPESVIGRKK